MKFSEKKIWILTASFISIFLYITLKLCGPSYCNMINIKRKIQHVYTKDPDTQNKTGLEDVRPLTRRKKPLYIPSKRENLKFTRAENNLISTCIKKYPDDFKKALNDFWSGTQAEIRRTHHSYLVAGESTIIEVGGNVGEDAQVFIDMYNPKHYVILEPLKLLYRKLQHRFENYTNVYLYNVGLAANYNTFMVKMEGKDGDATSPFFGSGEGTCSLKVINATDFFIKLGVGNYKVDLITINCEGCEYDLLETLISTDLIYQFKHIQFSGHSTIKNLRDPVRRYCQLQVWLSKTHTLTYQFKFQWESWKLK